MSPRKLRLNLIAALATSATVFYLGCGDDDDNATPSNGTGGRGGASSGTGGTSTGGGGTTGTGGNGTMGGGTGEGGTSEGGGTSGGSTGEGGGTSEGGGGGAPPQGGTSGAGAGGEGGGTAPDCEALNSDAVPCYEACTPTTSEQLLNACSGAECTPFDNSSLSMLGTNGSLPPLP